jgi:hypothetical protein
MPTTEVIHDEPPIASEFRARLREACAGQGDHMFVLLDGSRIQKLWIVLRELNTPHLCLFRESPKESLVHVAPFLARIPPDSDLALYLTFQDGALDAALLINAVASLEDLHRHFRRYLLMRRPNGMDVDFRFYDPRVLGPFLKSSTPEERSTFFAPIQSFFTYDAAATQEKGTLTLRTIPMPPPPPAGTLLRPPDATSKFQLRPEHEAELSSDVLQRYNARCIAYLRERHTERLEKIDDAGMLVLIARAMEEGKAIGLTSSLDVTRLCQVLLLGFTDEHRARLKAVDYMKRQEALRVLRDELTSKTQEARVG